MSVYLSILEPSSQGACCYRRAGVAVKIGLLLLLVVALTGRANAAAPPTPPEDSVDLLRAALREPNLAASRAKLEDAAKKIVSLSDLSRALLMTDWPSSTASALGRDIVPPAPGRDLADEIQEKLLRRFEGSIRKVLASGDALQRIAVVNLVREIFVNFRKQPAASTERFRERLRGLAPEYAALVRDPSSGVRIAVANALGVVEGDPTKTVPMLRRLLADADLDVRRAAADGLANLLLLTGQGVRNATSGIGLTPDSAGPVGDLTERARWVTEHGAVAPIMQAVPAAVTGLADKDVVVRRICSIAVRRGSQTLADLIRPTVDSSLPYSKSGLGSGGSSTSTPEQQRAWSQGVLKGLQGGLTMMRDQSAGLARAAADPDPVVRLEVFRAYEQIAALAERLRRLETTASPDVIDKPPVKTKDGTGGGRSTRRVGPLDGPVTVVVDDRLPQSAGITVDSFDAGLTGAPVALGSAPPSPPAGKAAPAVFAAPAAAPVPVLPKPRDETEIDKAVQKALEAMIKGLSDPTVRVRIATLEALEVLGERSAPAIPAIIKTVEDPNLFVRWAACRTLGVLAPRQPGTVVSVLARRFKPEEDLSVQIAAATALQAYGAEGHAAVPALVRGLKFDDDDVRLAIYKALERTGAGNAEALQALANGLKEKSQPIRLETAKSLGKLGPAARDALPALRKALFDPNDEVRRAASSAVLAIDVPK